MERAKKMLFWLLLSIGLIHTPISAEATNYRIGDRIEFGQKDGKPLVWDVVHVDANGNPLLFSSQILEWKVFDSTDQEIDGARRETGSNRWADSAIRQWLNSSDQVVSWKNGKPHSEAVEPSYLAYDKEPGFLASTFTESERSALLEVTRDVVLDEKDQSFRYKGNEHPIYMQAHHGLMILANSQYTYREQVKDRVFLFSIEEVERFLYKAQHLLPGKVATSIQAEPYQIGHSSAYWIVAPDYDGTTNLSVDNAGYYNPNEVNKGLGIRPAFYLNREKWTARSGDGSKDSPYAETETRIKFKKKTVSLYVGDGSVLAYDIEPNHRRVTLKWTSSSPKVASVNEKGVVFGHKIGKTTITVMTPSGQNQSVQVEVKSGTFKPIIKSYTVANVRKTNSNIELYDSYLSAVTDKSGGTSILKDSKQQTHIIYETEKDVRLVVYDRLLKVKKRITFKNEWPNFGDITLDSFGNYYILWGRTLDERDHKSSSIMITKYDANGKRLKSTSWNGRKLDTKKAFDAGNSRIIYQNGTLIAYFARLMFVHTDGLNHQASQVVYADAKTMKAIDNKPPYVSHSFNQQVIPMKDGSILFADQGDAFSRGFVISRLIGSDLIEFTPFHFREGENWSYGYNQTFAQLGGIAEGKEGYALLATSEKTLSAAPAKFERNESRNVFLQFFKTDVSRYLETEKIDDLFLVKGMTRKIVGKRPTSGAGNYYLDAGTTDKNVRWITNYKGTVDAAHPKLISTDDGRYIVMWEEFHNRKFKRTKLQVFSSYGDVLSKATDVSNARLPINEDILYRNGSLYWTTIKADYIAQNGVIKLHRLKVD